MLSTYRADLPEILEKIVHHALQKSPENRYTMGLNLAADLSLAFDYLDEPQENIELEEKFNAIQSLDFFRDFSEAEIWEIIHACIWQDFDDGEQIIVEGEIDDCFYIITSGTVVITKENQQIGELHDGDCFGEMGYLSKTERSATISAKGRVQLMKINSTLIEQVSVDCQLHFSKVFLRTLVKRLSETTQKVVSPI